MAGVFAITFVYVAFLWLVFSKFKLLRFTPAWGLISAFFVGHLLIVPLVGTRMQSPFTSDVRVVRHTVQIVPRLPEPTLVTDVFVRENTPIRKGDTLIVFDDSIYAAQVDAAEAALVAAQQNAKVLEADVAIATDSVARAQSDLDFALLQQQRFTDLAEQRAGPQERADEWTSRVLSAQAGVSGRGAGTAAAGRAGLCLADRRGEHLGHRGAGAACAGAILP